MVQWYRIRLPRQEMRVQSLGQEDFLEEDRATDSSVLSWRKSQGQRSLAAAFHKITKNWI